MHKTAYFSSKKKKNLYIPRLLIALLCFQGPPGSYHCKLKNSGHAAWLPEKKGLKIKKDAQAHSKFKDLYGHNKQEKIIILRNKK